MADRTPDPPLPLLVVDAANVVGSVPDGWWRDRRAAAARLRDALAPLAARGLAAADRVPKWATEGPLDIRMVVEGAARDLPGVPGVHVTGAPGSGDDEIVRLVAAEHASDPTRPCLVVTADRELRSHVGEFGAVVSGPHTLPRR
ncbi:NTP pyrophosphohydrolase [Yinghuangia sp. YIM S10712]|uniref:NTP pyrophosphohydrolase n=1 Tax=Yinghuangia sp. YIM S10712 TaxID=3436930 RepID=UPI003F531ACC